MKVGDLVRRPNPFNNSNGIGVIVEQSRDAGDGLGMYWRVLFDGEVIYVREADMEVVNESR